MNIRTTKRLPLLLSILLIIFFVTLTLESCTGQSKPAEKNTKKTSESGIVPNIEAGKPVRRRDLPSKMLPNGNKSIVIWGKNILINWMTIKPGRNILPEKLPADRVMIVLSDSIEQQAGGEYIKMSEKDCIYLEKGSQNAMRASDSPAEIVEIYFPVRLDYTGKTIEALPVDQNQPITMSKPTIPAGKVFSHNTLQFFEPEDNIQAQMIQVKKGQVCFLRMTPNAEISPEEQSGERFLVILQGRIENLTDGKKIKMEEGDVLYLISGMSHGYTVGPNGCIAMSVSSPSQEQYFVPHEQILKKYHTIIPRDAEPQLLVDGALGNPLLTMTEGPSWMNGKLYFSNYYMFWRKFGTGYEGGLNVLNSDGTCVIINKDIQPCGTTPLPNGNIAVCELLTKRLIEMTPDGREVRTLADSYKGMSLGYVNDVITDRKGGLYFTVPSQPRKEPKQPGTAVYYLNSEKALKRITEWNEFDFPNGCILSQDDSKFFLNDTRDTIVWVYDVNPDGTISNKQPFGRLHVSDSQFIRKSKGTMADGMALDRMGNLYVTTQMGIQMFDRSGAHLGIIYFQKSTSHCVFGGDDYSTLYVTCRTQVYSIKTNMTGFQYPLK